MSDLYTKAAKVKTTTKLWIIAVALLIMVNIPYVDNHYQPSPVAPTYSPAVVVPPTSPTVVAPKTLSLKGTDVQVQPSRQPTSQSLSGEYTGSAHNQTAALAAHLEIKLRNSSGTLSGFMSVKPPLYGSGDLMGTVEGKGLTFTVRSDIGTIVFTGAYEGDQITGKYTVQHPAGGQEFGRFSLSKKNATGRFLQTAKTLPTGTIVQPNNIGQPKKVRVLAEAPKVSTESTPHSDPKNYSSCMNGFSYACNKALLTPEEATNVEASDLRRNYSSCINGFSYACNKSLLTPDEATKVQVSDLRRNYSSCMNGFSYACNKALLTPEEAATVGANDFRRNYSSCLNGFSYACNKNLLTPEELSKVQASDLRRNYSACMNGMSYACNRNLLTSDQLLEVEAKEQGRRK